jgi:hypothetical protein
LQVGEVENFRGSYLVKGNRVAVFRSQISEKIT